MSSPDFASVGHWLAGLQQHIVDALAAFDGRPFRVDAWQSAQGQRVRGSEQFFPAKPDSLDAHGAAQGRAMLIENGDFFERGGVNFSQVAGQSLPAAASARKPELAGRRWQAMGVSLVLHPRNPHCPTTHMNVRCFVAQQDDAPPIWWFGGGMDLTPYYGYEEDCRHFHSVCREALAPFGNEVYGRYKAWCDEYFFLRHRNEARGIGGIFFDDLGAEGPLGEGGWDFARAFALTRAVGESFLAAYLPICRRRRDLPWGEREREFQLYRRGRYVEFNLVQDRGTLFGLQSGGRTEAILMSLPPLVAWRYDWQPEPGSAEERLITDFLPPRDWLELGDG